MQADELFTYVGLKTAETPIRIALCRRTRQLLSFFIGDGSRRCCKRLWRKQPYEYSSCGSFRDFWRSYNGLPAERHRKVGKESGQTNDVQRLNNTLCANASAELLVSACLFQRKNTCSTCLSSSLPFTIRFKLAVKIFYYQSSNLQTGVASAGIGTLLVSLAKNIPDSNPLKSWLVIAAPHSFVCCSLVSPKVDIYFKRRKLELLKKKNQGAY